MISRVFNKGNFNEWEKFCVETLPTINYNIRHKIIPQIDDVLISMLGERSNIIKESINTKQVFDENGMKSIYLDLVYIVNDWKVIDAPQKAIDADKQALLEALNDEQITSLDINTSTGEFKLQYLIGVK